MTKVDSRSLAEWFWMSLAGAAATVWALPATSAEGASQSADTPSSAPVLVGGVAQAEEVAGIRLEEIVVTAERRISDVQKTAASVSVRTGEELAQQGRYTLQDILRDVPNVAAPDLPTTPSLGGSDSAGGGVVIRGVAGSPPGGGNGTPLSGSSTTAVYVDGVYEGIGGDHDLQRLEILRGPQGTLYGRSATSGVVAIYTQDPSFDALSGDVSLRFANYTQRRYAGALNVPLGDSLAIRVSLSKEEADEGFYNGAGGAYDRVHGRVKALYRPTEDLSLLFGFAFEENDPQTGGCIGTSPALGVVVYESCTEVRTAHNDGRQYWLNLQWDLGPVSLYYQPALRQYYQTSSPQLVGPGGMFLTQTFETPHDQFLTQELRLASNEEGKLKWQTGFFHYWNNAQTENTNHVQSNGALVFDYSTRRDVKDYGLFGEATYAFTDATRLTLGARYDYTRVNSSQSFTSNTTFPGGQQGLPENNVTFVVNENTDPSGLRTWRKGNYKVRIEHDLMPQNLVYATVSTGFIPGDVSISSGQGVLPYEAETLTAYEVGSKNRFLAERLQVNGDVYFYDYGGFILEVYRENKDPRTAFTTTVPAKIWGFELETLYQLTSRDRFGLNYAFRDPRYKDKPADFAAEIPWETFGETGVATNNFTAPHTLNANYEHVFNLPGGSTLSARIDGIWTSSFRYLNPTTTMLTAADVGPGYLDYAYRDSGAIGNFNINWNAPSGRFSVGAYVRNFADHRWITHDVRTLTPARDVRAAESAPRTYALTLSAHF